jgi:hypothetical protein
MVGARAIPLAGGPQHERLTLPHQQQDLGLNLCWCPAFAQLGHQAANLLGQVVDIAPADQPADLVGETLFLCLTATQALT